MISLVQYLLDTGNIFKSGNLLTYSLFFGVILYVLVYLYMILYNQDSLKTISWWIVPIILIDLILTFVYYYNLKKKDSDFTTDNSEMTILEEDEDAFLEDEYENGVINDIVADVQELKNENIEILKQVEKEMKTEFEKEKIEQMEEKKQKPKKKYNKKKDLLDNIEMQINGEMQINENIEMQINENTETNNMSLD